LPGIADDFLMSYNAGWHMSMVVVIVYFDGDGVLSVGA
jgi:hypothetical protein